MQSPTTQVVFTLWEFLGTSGAPVAFYIWPFPFIVPPTGRNTLQFSCSIIQRLLPAETCALKSTQTL